MVNLGRADMQVSLIFYSCFDFYSCDVEISLLISQYRQSGRALRSSNNHEGKNSENLLDSLQLRKA